MGIILFIVSVLLNILLSIPALIHTIAGSIRYKSKFAYIDSAFMRGAKALDIFGNVAYGTLLNDLFIKKGGYHFGQGTEKISSAAGKNWILGKLTPLGLGLTGTLNLIDFKNWKNGGHCWTAIEGGREHYHSLRWPGTIKWYYTFSFLIISTTLLYLLFRLLIWIF
ncbi:hypothetical protein [Dyadobacter sp. LHD-138]|uniref:hypothetical protein n=1 Tax=Dyadobacter sp. LHD-138 TaxID=3071413 RepID=UPI0027E1B0AC|nr:hypothetical protein [Dyadobacter sp. LHD-138]MDQ6482240.1 hypothetical protein [Dyadobacter sp. LHD-138]